MIRFREDDGYTAQPELSNEVPPPCWDFSLPPAPPEPPLGADGAAALEGAGLAGGAGAGAGAGVLGGDATTVGALPSVTAPDGAVGTLACTGAAAVTAELTAGAGGPVTATRMGTRAGATDSRPIGGALPRLAGIATPADSATMLVELCSLGAAPGVAARPRAKNPANSAAEVQARTI